MLMKNEIWAKIGSRSIQHYKKLGYILPEHPIGKSILVRIADLPSGSSLKIPVQCDNCGKEIYKYNKYI